LGYLGELGDNVRDENGGVADHGLFWFIWLKDAQT
jgi:hypothetical protein